MVDKKKQGKRNRINGANFERKVRKDLEEKGWIVDKWSNNVEFNDCSIEDIDIVSQSEWDCKKNLHRATAISETEKDYLGSSARFRPETIIKGKCIPAKRKYNPFNKVMAIGTGFPDFIAYKINNASIDVRDDGIHLGDHLFEIQFVECKSNGCLDKIEKAKAKWYLDNNYCSKFLIVSKKKVGRKVEVEYNEV